MSLMPAPLRRANSYLKAMFNPNSFKYAQLHKMGVAYERAGDRASAIRFYSECLRLKPSQELEKNLGLLYYEIEDYRRAIDCLGNSALDPEACLFLALSYLKCHDVKKAQQVRSRLVPKTPEYRMLSEHIDEYTGKAGTNGHAEAHSGDDAGSGLDRWYEVLQLPPGSSEYDIKKAYKMLAKEWHPDRFFNDRERRVSADRQMKLLNEAYSRLCSGSS